jgi:ankyrin repeat protein
MDHYFDFFKPLAEDDLEEFQKAIVNGVELNRVREITGISPMQVAIDNKSIKVLKAILLTEYGKKNINEFDETQHTPLMSTVREHNIAFTKILLDAGADVNVHDEPNIGNTAISEAVHEGENEIAALLLSHGANPTIPGWMQLNAIDRAQRRVKSNGTERDRDLLAMLEAAAKRFTASR